MARAVRFDKYGDENVLYLAEVEIPEPGPDQVVVRVRSAGVSTGEVGIRSGAMDKIAPAHFPEGEGSEFSGIVHSTGTDVEAFNEGDEVLGLTDDRGAQADYAITPAKNLIPKPPSVEWDTAAGIPSAGGTATSVMSALKLKSGETVVVAGASGGVGLVTVQLAVQAGARVIATASGHNHDYLRELGANPVSYGDGLQDAVRALAPDGVDAFADCHGDGNVDVAISLGVPPERINTIKDFEAAKRTGAQTEGLYQLNDITAAVLTIVDQVAAGEIKVPIKASFPLEQVADAYRRLTQPGGIGRIVLTVSTD